MVKVRTIWPNLGLVGFALIVLTPLATPCQAGLYDLTEAGSSVVINGARFMTTDIAPTGSGVINSFVRLQAEGDEEGYNTDAKKKKFPYDEKAGSFTHSLLLSDVPIVTVDNLAYREFVLDINQRRNKPLLSMDRLMIFQETVGDLSVPVGSLGTALYDLDRDEDNSIVLNYALGHGSGSGDMYAYIPDALFRVSAGDFVYLYSRFGDREKSNAGYEEWFVQERPALLAPLHAPVPAAVLLGMLGLATAGWGLRRFA